MALISIVNRDHVVIGKKPRADITKDDIYTASVLWILDQRNRILLSQRVFTKKNSPGKWGPSASGTIEYDEKYIDNVIKEAKQELGITIDPSRLQPGPLVFNNHERSYFAQTYMYHCNQSEDEFVTQYEEVLDVKWFEIEKIDELLVKYPEMFTSSFANNWAQVRTFFNSTPLT